LKAKIGEWFRQLWLDPQKRHALAGEYLSLRQSHPLFLADLALRGRVWSDLVVLGDRDATMVNLGRRELALEIIELAEIEPQRLFQLIERAPLKDVKNG
jgi:hypothetical protein